MLNKESTGFEPVHRFYTARWISSPVHYRSANSPQIIFSHFFIEMQGLFFIFWKNAIKKRAII